MLFIISTSLIWRHDVFGMLIWSELDKLLQLHFWLSWKLPILPKHTSSETGSLLACLQSASLNEKHLKHLSTHFVRQKCVFLLLLLLPHTWVSCLKQKLVPKPGMIYIMNLSAKRYRILFPSSAIGINSTQATFGNFSKGAIVLP